MPSLTTMICVALIVLEMVVSVKGADPSAFRSETGLASDIKAAAGSDIDAMAAVTPDTVNRPPAIFDPFRKPTLKPTPAYVPFNCFPTPTKRPYFVCDLPTPLPTTPGIMPDDRTNIES